MKTCPSCLRELAEDAFYNRSDRQGKISSYCRSCVGIQTSNRQRRLKQLAIYYKGGCCEDCGTTGHPAIFDFHHLDPSEKDFNVADKKCTTLSKELIDELDKCVLLCSNCHRIRHAKYSVEDCATEEELQVLLEYAYTGEKPPRKRQVILSKRDGKSQVVEEEERQCKVCESVFMVKSNDKKIFCSKSCSAKWTNRTRQKVQIEKETLKALLWELPTTQIAKKFGVSDKAIEKLAKKFELEKPPRGYWAKMTALDK